MIRAGIVGISGYSGETALKILLKHPHVRVTYVSANNTTGDVAEIIPQLKGHTSLICQKYNTQKAIRFCDVVILAVPHTVAMEIVPDLITAKKRIIDLSADYRLKDPKKYQKWYGVAHKDKGNLKGAVYGLSELYRQNIKKAALVANPGCYPTPAILALAPWAATRAGTIQSMIIDAKSGVTGAGRKIASSMMFSEVNENFKAYKVLNHQHTPEISDYLSKFVGSSLDVTFIPHLLPINRGILETIYVHVTKPPTIEELGSLYSKFYKKEKFIRILQSGQMPEIKHVVGTNYCDIGLAVSKEKKLIVIVSAIDNLMKGAAGQAVQNLNIMCGFDESTGLTHTTI